LAEEDEQPGYAVQYFMLFLLRSNDVSIHAKTEKMKAGFTFTVYLFSDDYSYSLFYLRKSSGKQMGQIFGPIAG